MKIKLILLAWCLFICLIAFSQANNQPLDIKAPNISSLYKLEKIGVNSFTGSPDISIPLLSLKAKTFAYDLVLSYSPHAVKPNQRGGWTGLGWNLNLGYVTRKQRDEIDEKVIDAGREIGFYKNDYLDVSTWADIDAFAKNPANFSYSYYFDYYDTEPDIFNFNILGKTGKFFLDQKKNWKVQSDDFVKVELDSTVKLITPPINIGFSYPATVSVCFNKFILTDKQGNKFVLGGANGTEYSASMTGKNTGATVSGNTWYLKEIIPANSLDHIDFEYERGPYISNLYQYASQNLTVADDVDPGFNFSNWKILGSVISPVYIKKITLNDQEISFDFDKSSELNYPKTSYNYLMNDLPDNLNEVNQLVQGTYQQIPFYRDCNCNVQDYYQSLIWMKLNKIEYRVRDEQYRSVQFNYTDTATQRLTLNRLDINGYSGGLESYKFEYNQIASIPKYLEVVSDHWGFNNGVNFSGSNFGNMGSARSIDTTKMFIGLLKSITYPTKGKVELAFESGDYSKVVDTKNRKLLNAENGKGNIRIASILEYAKDGTLLGKRHFVYKISNSNISSGILNMKPLYSLNRVKQYTMGNKLFSMSSILSNSVNDLSDDMGVTIGYTEVKEIAVNGTQKYATIYQYTNHDNGRLDDNAVSSSNSENLLFRAYSSRAHERGRLLQMSYLDVTGDTVYTKRNAWEYQYNVNAAGRSVLFNYLKVNPSSNDYAFFSGIAYYNYYYPVLLKSSTETNFKDNMPLIAKKTKFFYDPIFRNLKKSIDYSSSNDSIELINYYVDDFSSKIGFSFSILNTMQKKGLFSWPIEQIKKRNGKVISGTLFEYTLFKNLVQNAKVYNLKVSEPKTGYTGVSLNPDGSYKRDASYSIRFENLNFDKKGNATEYRDRKLPIESVVWGRYGYNPIIQVKNASNLDVKSTVGNNFDFDGYVDGYKPFPIYEDKIETLQTNLGKSQVYGFDSKPYIGYAKIIGPNNSKANYTYDGLGRLIEVSDTKNFITSKISYYYANQYLDRTTVFYNKGDSVRLQRNDCAVNRKGSYELYKVLPKAYSSLISQQHADSLEREDILQNAQTWVNAHGTCERVLITSCLKRALLIPIDRGIEKNLYITYIPCGGTAEVTVALANNFPETRVEDGIRKVEICSSNTSLIQFRYGAGGQLVAIPEIQIENLGVCN
ncbi:MAG: DUF5977 domain-containing protein [Sphingobacterium sp.]|jgi:hypothetical protein|nr:DUF5977 domain-containing protein [Sphingobacterium sp.]